MVRIFTVQTSLRVTKLLDLVPFVNVIRHLRQRIV